MTSREQFTLDAHKTPLTSQPQAQNVLLGYSADGTAVYSGSGGGGGGGGSATAATAVPHNVNVGGTVKRKRGRPRKYGPNGAMTLSLTPAPLPPATVPQSAGTFSPPRQLPPPSVPLGGGGSESHSSLKKGRGRPPGSSKKQQMEALGNFIVFLYYTE